MRPESFAPPIPWTEIPPHGKMAGMSRAANYRIKTPEELRAIIGELNPVVSVKLMTALDDAARDYKTGL